jgi:hypothetical protein
MYEMKKHYYLFEYVDHIMFSTRLIQLIAVSRFTAAVNPMKVCSTFGGRYLKINLINTDDWGAKLQSLIRLKLSLSLRQWSRKYTILN